MDFEKIQVCPHCGAVVTSADELCSKCGRPVVIRASEPDRPAATETARRASMPKDGDDEELPQTIDARVHPGQPVKKKQGSAVGRQVLTVLLALVLVGGIGFAVYYFVGDGLGGKTSVARDYEDDEEELDGEDDEAVEQLKIYADDDEAEDRPVMMEPRAEPTETAEALPPSPEEMYDVACQRPLTENDVKDLTAEQLRIMRNWIYAKRGFIFTTPDMKAFFSRQPWYEGRYTDAEILDHLTPQDHNNIDFIKQHER